jgi:integrase
VDRGHAAARPQAEHGEHRLPLGAPLLSLLVEEDEIERSPMDKMRSPSVPVNPPAVLSEQDVDRSLKACAGTDFDDRQDLAILMLMMDTGLRRGELAAASWRGRSSAARPRPVGYA